MSKVKEFYAKAIADDVVKAELAAVFGSGKIEDATDEQLAKVSEIAKKLGYEFSVEEAKAYLNGNDEDGELDDDDLESVAGGFCLIDSPCAADTCAENMDSTGEHCTEK